MPHTHDPVALASSKPMRNLYALACLVLVVAALYFARSVLIPVVLAVLLAFLLSPIMLGLERRGFRRPFAALTVVFATLLLVGGMTALVSQQMRRLMVDLPQHKEAIIAKIEELRDGAQDSWLAGFSSTLNDISRRLAEASKENEAGEQQPTPVKIVPSSLSFAHSALSPLTEVLISGALVLILTFFILLRREDMRNRLIRLWGVNRLRQATEAMDDIGRRIGWFLISQLVVNVAFGVLFGLGLWALGVPYPLLGGFLGGLMRYVPYLGVWIAGIGPVILTLALVPGWLPVVLVVVFVAVIEVIFAHIIEPIVFGKSIGVSEVALLVALAFWGWLWGMAGMILATPLTACLLVMSRHLPRMRFLAILLGDDPPLKPRHALYQRLLAGDTHEVEQLLADYRAEHPGEQVYEDLLLGVLRVNQSQGAAGQVNAEEEKVIYSRIRDLLPAPVLPANEDASATTTAMTTTNGKILGISAGEEANEVALEFFSRLLPREMQARFEIAPATLLTGEVIRQIEEEQPSVIVLAAVHRQSLPQVRLLLKRLHHRWPEMKVLVAWWGGKERRRKAMWMRRRFLEQGADAVGATMLETRSQISGVLPPPRPLPEPRKKERVQI